MILIVGEVAIRTDVLVSYLPRWTMAAVAEIAGGGSDIAINTLLAHLLERAVVVQHLTDLLIDLLLVNLQSVSAAATIGKYQWCYTKASSRNRPAK